jgi:hypothetical protein
MDKKFRVVVKRTKGRKESGVLFSERCTCCSEPAKRRVGITHEKLSPGPFLRRWIRVPYCERHAHLLSVHKRGLGLAYTVAIVIGLVSGCYFVQNDVLRPGTTDYGWLGGIGVGAIAFGLLRALKGRTLGGKSSQDEHIDETGCVEIAEVNKDSFVLAFAHEFAADEFRKLNWESVRED